MAHAAWDGIDLVRLNATRVAGRVLGHRAADIEEWLFSVPGREVLHDSAEDLAKSADVADFRSAGGLG